MTKTTSDSSEKSQNFSKPSVVPYIAANVHLPEITIKGVFLGVILAILLAGSNAYLGLKMGQTLSASIPAAVISMTVLRLFRRSNILENNIVQTIASAGEVVAAGIIFTIPALVVMKYWTNFGYWQVTIIAVIGSVIGTLFSIPLRRALIVESDLRFPEGIATAEVLKAGDLSKDSSEEKGAKYLVYGALGASFVKLCQSGFHVVSDAISGWCSLGGAVFGFSNGLSLSMLGAGYIVGMKIGINLLLGTILAWVIGVPFYSFFSSGPQDFGLLPDASAFDFAMAIRSEKIRYIGVGTMIFGGVWALLSIAKPIKNAVSSSFEALSKSRKGNAVVPLRTEFDVPMYYVVLGTIIMSVPIFFMFHHVFSLAGLDLPLSLYWTSVSVLTLISLFVGFICSSIGGYMAGIVGSSANPMSGITIGAILIMCLSILVLLSGHITFGVASPQTLSLAAATIIVSGIVAVAAAFGCDNLQDLKSGQLVGSTPWKQQVMLIVGALSSAVVVAPILELLYQAYGVGGVFPRENMDPTQGLAAPQAMLMASVTQGIFEGTLDWNVVGIGIMLGAVILAIDKLILDRLQSEYRLSVLAVALGIYLPMDVIAPLVVGAFVHYLGQRKLSQTKTVLSEEDFKKRSFKTDRQGLLFSAGMIAGEALVGILLAIPFAAYQSTDILSLVGPSFSQTATVFGVSVFLAVCYYLYVLGHQDCSKEVI